MDRRREMLPISRVHCDVRLEDGLGAQAMEQELRAAIDTISERRGVRVETDPYATFGPVSSEANKAPRQWRRELISWGSIVPIAPLRPSAMLSVPGIGGITNGASEYSMPEQLARGSQVLLGAVMDMAG